MAETYSVEAVLSAYDKGFTSAMKHAMKTTDSFSDKMKSGLSFGVFSGIGQQALNTITNGVRDLFSEINDSSKAWQTFEGNMKILKKGDKYIKNTKKELQSFAEQTVYSSSDMAQTFAQLEAVGTKNTLQLVKGFGGLAAAAEDPQQAMKTLSQQGTQMAAKPYVAWQDFKLMLEQTPAGMAAVAKAMGMTTEELIVAIQKGTVKTEDFFAAVEKAGNSKGFQDMATSYKTVDQAMDGLSETVGNKLMPAFKYFSDIAIKGIEGIIDIISKINADKLTEKLKSGMKKAKPYWVEFKKVALVVWKALKKVGAILVKVGKFFLDHADTISKAIPYLLGLLGAYKAFKIVNSLVPGVMSFAKGITSLAEKGISAIAGKLFGIAAGEKAAGTASSASASQVMAAAKSFFIMGAAVLMIAGGFWILTDAAVKLAEAGGLAIGVMAGMTLGVIGLGVGIAMMLKFLAPMSAQLMPVATALLAVGAAVVLVAAGFWILSNAAINLANAGTPAIACMFGLVVAISALMGVAALVAPILTAGAIGLLAFGGALLMVGAGVFLACSGIAILAMQLPTVATYGGQAAVAFVKLGGALIVFGAGALTAGAGALVLGAGLIVCAAGLLLVGATSLVAAVGVLALAAAAGLLGTALMRSVTPITIMAAALPLAAAGALLTTAAFTVLMAVTIALAASLLVLNAPLLLIGASALVASAGMTVFGGGMIVAAAGTLVLAGALKLVDSSLKTIAKNAKSAEKSIKSMKSSVKVVESGLNALGSKAKSAALTAVNQINAKFRAGRSGAYSAGVYISKGLASGMKSCLSIVRNAASQLAQQAEKAIKAKAKIASPSKVSEKLGAYFGEGFAEGIASMQRKVSNISESLISIPQIATPNLAFGYSGGLSADYEYSRNANYTIEVPLNIDGREFARAEAGYMQDELDRNQTFKNRKLGKL